MPEVKTDFKVELTKNFLDYSEEVIKNRAIPDVRDGLKPVHRRILWTMWHGGFKFNSSMTKSAKVSGDCMGNFHPHGDCIRGDSIVYCLNGEHKTIEEIYKNGIKEVDVLSYCETTNSYKPAKAHSFRIGQNSKNIYKITFSNNMCMEVTANHPILSSSKKWIKAENLKKFDLIESGFLNDINGYEIIKSYLKVGIPVHRLIGHSIFQDFDLKNDVIHHKNENKKDNSPNNLEKMSKKEHALHHKNFLRGLEIGRNSMFTPDGVFRSKIKEKNKKLIKEYNSNQGILKAIHIIKKMIEENTELTIENYNIQRKEKYNYPFIEKMIEKNQIKSFEDLICISMNYIKNKKSTKKKSISKKKNMSFLSMLDSRQESSLAKIIKCMIEEKNIISFDFYDDCVNILKKKRCDCCGLKGQKTYPKKEDVIDFYNSSNLEEISCHLNSSYLCYVQKIEKISLIDEIPMYDFTVNDYENMVFVDSKNSLTKKYVVLHNSAIYESLVRMAQSFSMQNPFIAGQGNFGSIEMINSFAAARYTECKLSEFAEDVMFKDIDYDTVEMVDNYLNDDKEPTVLPARLPMVLLTGSSGIAVGMKTDIPPHNLKEVCNTILAYVENTNLTTKEILKILQGPDFPLGGTIDKSALMEIYSSGNGLIPYKSSFEIDGRDIIFTSIPYASNKCDIMSELGELAEGDKVEGISDIIDESEGNNVRIVLQLKRTANQEDVLEKVFKHTNLGKNFQYNVIAICNKKPRLLAIGEVFKQFVEFRQEVITKRTTNQKEKLEKRKEILDGIIVAINNSEDILKIIKTKTAPVEVIKNNYQLSDVQANYIYNMPMKKFSKTDTEEIRDEIKKIKANVEELSQILKNKNKVLEIIKEETVEIREKYGKKRKTTHF